MLVLTADDGTVAVIHFHYDTPAGRNPTVNWAGSTFHIQTAEVEALDPVAPLGVATEELNLHNPALEGHLRVAHTNTPESVHAETDYLSIEYRAIPSVMLLQHRNVASVVFVFEHRAPVPNPLSHTRSIFTTRDIRFARTRGASPPSRTDTTTRELALARRPRHHP